MQKFDWKTLYFVLATLLGLVLIVIGVVSGVNTALTTYVFPVRPFPQSYQVDPPGMYSEQGMKTITAREDITDEQKAALEQWRQDYQKNRELEAKYDYAAEDRKRSMANAVAMILAGIPVFALHAPHVFRGERKAKK